MLFVHCYDNYLQREIYYSHIIIRITYKGTSSSIQLLLNLVFSQHQSRLHMQPPDLHKEAHYSMLNKYSKSYSLGFC